MKISTPDFLNANFFMKNEPLEDVNILPHVMPHQVHGKNIIIVNDETFSKFALPERPEADGILLMTSKAEASLRFADCAPVLIWGKSFAMLLHSGYKGTVLNISGAGIELVNENVKYLHAWIGPCIGREIYCRDINDEWTQKGIKSFHRENYDYDEADGKIYFDLAGEIKSQLLDAGLDERNIMLTGINTYEDERCYSYRRGDKVKRMMLHVKIKCSSKI